MRKLLTEQLANQGNMDIKFALVHLDLGTVHG